MSKFWILLLVSGVVWAKSPVVEMKTSEGTIVIELDEKKAPATVKNFLSYVKDKFYDDTIFHRVINGFMIQGGGFKADMSEKETKKPVQNEADNGLGNEKYTVAMARTSDPHSATAQFFINVENNTALNYKSKTPGGYGYTVFGKVTKGTDVVDKIKLVKVHDLPQSKGGHENVPETPVMIKSIRLKK